MRRAPKRKLLQTRSSVVSSMLRQCATKLGKTRTEFEAYVDDPVGFIEGPLGDELVPKQREICEAVRDGDFTAIVGARGIGKTWLCARLVIWWLCTRPGSVAITTAPVWFQVKNLLWRNIREAFENSKEALPGDCLQTEWNISPSWYALGLSVDDPIRFQGHHSQAGVLYIADEASGVEDEIHDAAMGFLTEGKGKVILISNPNKRQGLVWRVFDPVDTTTSHWVGIQVSAFDVPELVKQKWIDQVISACGSDYEAHPLYQVQVLGAFPDSDETGLYPMSLLNKSEYAEPSEVGRHMGVDLSRGGVDFEGPGGDLSVAVLTVNGRVSACYSWTKSRTTASAKMVKRLMKQWKVPGENIHVDVIGIGGGVVDALKDDGVNCDPVNFGPGLGGEYNYLMGEHVQVATRRAELHWAARRLLEEGELSVPSKYHEIRADMSQLWYGYDSRGRLTMPDKKAVKKLIGRSPDFSDALLLSLSRPTRSKVTIGRRRKKDTAGKKRARYSRRRAA